MTETKRRWGSPIQNPDGSWREGPIWERLKWRNLAVLAATWALTALVFGVPGVVGYALGFGALRLIIAMEDR